MKRSCTLPWAHHQGDLKLPIELQRVMVQRLRYCYAPCKLLVCDSVHLLVRPSAILHVLVCLSISLSVTVHVALPAVLYMYEQASLLQQVRPVLLHKCGRDEGYLISQIGDQDCGCWCTTLNGRAAAW